MITNHDCLRIRDLLFLTLGATGKETTQVLYIAVEEECSGINFDFYYYCELRHAVLSP